MKIRFVIMMLLVLITIGFISCEFPSDSGDSGDSGGSGGSLEEDQIIFNPPEWLIGTWLTLPNVGSQFLSVSSDNILFASNSTDVQGLTSLDGVSLEIIESSDQFFEFKLTMGSAAASIIDIYTFQLLNSDTIEYSWYNSSTDMTTTLNLYKKLIYNVSFDSMGGSSVDDLIGIDRGETISEPLFPQKGGDSFIGWFKEPELINKWDFTSDIVTSDLILYARWSGFYTVSFDSTGGSAVPGITGLIYGDKITEPSSTKFSYSLEGWAKEPELINLWNFSLDTIIASDLVLYAKWIHEFIVTPQVIMSGISAVSAGSDHTMILTTDGVLYGTGGNRSGELGDGTNTQRLSPVEIMTGVADVSAGFFHTMILTTDGILYGTGGNFSGQLGNRSELSVSSPVEIMTGVAYVSAGSDHTMILTTDGVLYGTGSNLFGQLGLGLDGGGAVNRPIQIMTGVASVSAGSFHTMILTTDGTLYGAGNNWNGELGDGTNTHRSSPVEIMTGVASVSAGSDHTMILTTDGTLYGTGSNSTGKLGDGTNTQRLSPVEIMAGVASVSAGSSHTMILTTDGTLYGVGTNWDGELGDGTNTQRLSPVEIMTGVASVSAAQSHTMILTTDGTLYGTGKRNYGQLGDG